MKINTKELSVKKDTRGWLAEILRPEDVKVKQFGQILVTTAYPGETKGNHYHMRKKEWYCVIKGQAQLTLVDRKTQEKKEITMGDNSILLVEIPPNVIHSIKNTGQDEMYLIAYISEAFNPQDPDTYYV